MDSSLALSAKIEYPQKQFFIFRVFLGLYLIIHFIFLFPDSSELFSNAGVLADPSLNPLSGIFPNPLAIWDNPNFIKLYLLAAIALAIFFTFNKYFRLSAIMLWFIWASLFNRNNLISNPSIPYIGLLLVMCSLIPKSYLKKENDDFPAWLYYSVWILLAFGYTFSGVIKLYSPSWINGEALSLLMENPLSRSNIFCEIFMALPDIIKKMCTWSALVLEIVFLPLILWRKTSFILWASLLFMHIGILFMISFADLTFGMIITHVYVFNMKWFRK